MLPAAVHHSCNLLPQGEPGQRGTGFFHEPFLNGIDIGMQDE